MADILPFVPKKPDRLGRAAEGTFTPTLTGLTPRITVLTCTCGCQAFVCEWPTGDLICADCGVRSNNFQVIQPL